MSNIRDIVKYEDVKDITPKAYFTGEAFAADMFLAKYSLTKDNKEKETPADMFWRVSYGLACMEETPAFRDKYAELWFSLMWNGWFRPGGSVLAGVGAPGRQSLLNCTTLPLDGDSIEDIARCDYTIMKCAAFRQGLGIDASNLRPRGAFVNNAAMESTGVVPWISKLVDNGKYVGQKGRMPALLVSIKVHHPDVVEFITAKTKSGAIENANISIQITDKFMEAVKADAEWELYFEFEDNKYPRISRMMPAKELFTLICDTAYTSAEPGVQFIDELRRGSMVHRLYEQTNDARFKLISTNACCFVDTVIVSTDKGDLLLSEVRDRLSQGEKINALSYNVKEQKQEYKPIIDCFAREEGKVQQTITLELENGKTIECTPDHKFYTNRGLVSAKDLNEDDDILEV